MKIGNIDQAACAGMHVKNTEELEMVLIARVTSAGPLADLEIEFEVGERAKRSSLDLSTVALVSSEKIGSRPQDLCSALDKVL